MKRKFSKAMGKRVGQLTNRIFNDSVKEVMGFDGSESEQDLLDTIADLRWVTMKLSIDDPYSTVDQQMLDLKDKKQQVDDLYLKRLCGLSSSQLQEIVICHENGHIKRMQKTIEAILFELASREMLGDTSKSDSRYTNEVVDELAETNKRRSKKTTGKRNKTSEDR